MAKSLLTKILFLSLVTNVVLSIEKNTDPEKFGESTSILAKENEIHTNNLTTSSKIDNLPQENFTSSDTIESIKPRCLLFLCRNDPLKGTIGSHGGNSVVYDNRPVYEIQRQRPQPQKPDQWLYQPLPPQPPPEPQTPCGTYYPCPETQQWQYQPLPPQPPPEPQTPCGTYYPCPEIEQWEYQPLPPQPPPEPQTPCGIYYPCPETQQWQQEPQQQYQHSQHVDIHVHGY